MTNHKIYEVSWSEDGRKKKSYFAEVGEKTFLEFDRKVALVIDHNELHKCAVEYPNLLTKPMHNIANYFDSVSTIRTIGEA